MTTPKRKLRIRRLKPKVDFSPGSVASDAEYLMDEVLRSKRRLKALTTDLAQLASLTDTLVDGLSTHRDMLRSFAERIRSEENTMAGLLIDVTKLKTGTLINRVLKDSNDDPLLDPPTFDDDGGILF